MYDYDYTLVVFYFYQKNYEKERMHVTENDRRKTWGIYFPFSTFYLPLRFQHIFTLVIFYEDYYCLWCYFVLVLLLLVFLLGFRAPNKLKCYFVKWCPRYASMRVSSLFSIINFLWVYFAKEYSNDKVCAKKWQKNLVYALKVKISFSVSF